MEGISFYWFAWMGWIIITFFMKKGKLRTRLASLVLILLITAHHHSSFSKIEVSYGFIVLLLITYIQVAYMKNSKLLYILICTFILTFAYVSFQLFRLFDPIWVIFQPSFMVAFILIYLVLLLAKSRKERIIMFLFGVSHGEILYGVIMDYFRFPYSMGNLSFFDVVVFGIILLFMWDGIERLSAMFNQGISKTSKRKAGIL
ncbi:YphA family membrane protein [Bacillus sp. DJP31]|uniref:YphA family membrane protein n=1 Tax=Bacillus sp. DJP31 TaxID=3409789 RepID=UPI003BB67BB2